MSIPCRNLNCAKQRQENCMVQYERPKILSVIVSSQVERFLEIKLKIGTVVCFELNLSLLNEHVFLQLQEPVLLEPT